MSESHHYPDDIQKIWTTFSDRLRSFIYLKVKDDTLADDLLQDVFIKIHATLDQLRDKNKIQSWLYRIASNTVNDHFRKTGRFREDSFAEPAEPEVEESNPFLEEALEDMVKMMDQLPSEYCDVLCKTELGGMSQKEYAEQTGISLTAAKTRAFRARNMLKDMLMRCCHYQFDTYGTVIDIHPATCCCCCPSCN